LDIRCHFELLITRAGTDNRVPRVQETDVSLGLLLALSRSRVDCYCAVVT